MRTGCRRSFAAAFLLATFGAAASRGDPPPAGLGDHMPSLTIPAAGMPLDDVLAAVKKADPAFRYVIVRRADAPADVPRVPPMELTDMTFGQFLTVLRIANSDVEFQFVDGTKDQPGFLAFTIRPPSFHDASRDTSVRVFGLTDSVLPRAAVKAGDGDHVKEATDDVLSAIQTAVDVAALPGPAVVLKIHQPTFTLIARGTGAQLDLISQTVNALRPSKDELMAALAQYTAAAAGRPKPEPATRPGN